LNFELCTPAFSFSVVSDNLPSVTVLIAARPDQAEIKAVNAARQLDYPSDRLEIIVARGKQPSVQRNAAMKAARGEWLYFLDDDSEPGPGTLRRAAVHFSDPVVKMVGGPNLCPPGAPPLEQVFAVVLASWLAFGPSRARYAAVGNARATSEKELILCNLLARRDAMLELGGFNEALYPNEENALMDELQKRGGKLIYDPQLFVHRRPRRTLKSFVKMLMTYGRGRAEQFRLNPTFGSALNFVPPLFCLYLIALAVVVATQFGRPLAGWSAAPLGVYALVVVLQTLASIRTHGVVRSLLAMPLLVASHILYGFGFWRGLFTRLKSGPDRPAVQVALETVAR
jgi:cellulose synthase/poly-beta-1,6-N-acetylglucosamine synthase-like glycosyltransferase